MTFLDSEGALSPWKWAKDALKILKRPRNVAGEPSRGAVNIVEGMWQDGQIRGSKMGELGSEDEEEERRWAGFQGLERPFERLRTASKSSKKLAKSNEIHVNRLVKVLQACFQACG